ncbi:di-N-acetylchitobiase-like [Nerophis ophidion]|uniref:di-N-acetylchitobiase-like n=1 Tax=Nerophis ophidion TaxID=159077 RepID=UPI002AE066F9|nr:di-N-acetylchitobiase-like [Nerophis ophidion]XP_061739009.1 di-N-acetylchitobiase-like [Nerophis ophidion]
MSPLLMFLSSIIMLSWADVCPCERPELCQQIQDEKDFEVFVFDVGGKTWKWYDWSVVTTVATFGKYDGELMCHAHSKGARVVLKGDVHLASIVDQSNRTAWITEMVDLARRQFMDGINLDIEQAVEEGSPEYSALTDLVKETTEAFHKQIPGSQVSFDVAWSPQCVDKRCYDYVAIADSCDLLFVMSYDEQSQILGDCIAMANSPVTQTLGGYDQYLKISVDPKKLLMGVPWYGYDYPCINFTQDGVCYVAEVPFRGAPCSDAAGKQKTYKWINKQMSSSLSGRLWDDKQQAPYFNYKDPKGQIHQVWYDDPESICLKTHAVQSKGLRGVGMWNANILDYSDDPVARQQSAAMWNALFGCQPG